MYQRRSNTMALTATAILTPEHVSTRTFHDRLDKKRYEQTVREDLTSYQKEQVHLQVQNASEERVDSLRRIRRYQQQNQEFQHEYMIENMKKEQEQRRLLAEQDEQLAAAIAHQKNEKEAEERMIRRIVEESDELIQLRSLLKQAEINKCRATQKVEKEVEKQHLYYQNAQIDATMEVERLTALELERQEEERKKGLLLNNRQILQGQMQEKERQKHLAYETFLKEKSMVDEVVRSINKEEEAKLQKQIQQRLELQESIRQYLDDREIWREEERRRAKEELIKIQQYQLIQEERLIEIQKQKQKKSR